MPSPNTVTRSEVARRLPSRRQARKSARVLALTVVGGIAKGALPGAIEPAQV
jgi:predicted ATPase